MILFKYIKRKYLIELRKTGKTRIGTLYDYRTAEGAIQDKSEGCITNICNPSDEKVELNPEEASKLFFPNKLNGGMVIMPKSSVERINTVLDTFVYCTSLIYDKELETKFECDSYFIINDLSQFAKMIHDELKNKHFPMQDYNMRKVNYVNKKTIFITNANKTEVIENISNDPWEGFFVKPQSNYSDEKEFRMVFPP